MEKSYFVCWAHIFAGAPNSSSSIGFSSIVQGTFHVLWPRSPVVNVEVEYPLCRHSVIHHVYKCASGAHIVPSVAMRGYSIFSVHFCCCKIRERIATAVAHGCGNSRKFVEAYKRRCCSLNKLDSVYYLLTGVESFFSYNTQMPSAAAP